MIRSVWHVYSESDNVDCIGLVDSYFALHQLQTHVIPFIDGDAEQKSDHIETNKVLPLIHELELLQISDVGTIKGAGLDGVSYAVEIGDAYGCRVKWWNEAPDGFSELVPLANRFATLVDQSLNLNDSELFV